MFYCGEFKYIDLGECRRRQNSIELTMSEEVKRLYRDDATKLIDKINSFAELEDFEKYYYNIYGGEPLHHAIRCSNINVAKTLILRGADLNKEDRYFYTPLYYALKADNEAIVSLLLSNNVSATGIFNEYMVGIPTYYFEYVCEKSNTKILKLFLSNGCTANDDLFTFDTYSCSRKCRPLHAAIMSGKIETVKILINCGADVNKQNLLNETPLYLACMGGFTDIVAILLKNNALVNVPTNDNNKLPLYEAIKSCDPHIVKLLLENGGVIDNKDPQIIRNIYIPLYTVIKNGGVEIVKYLLDTGLNPNLHFERYHTSTFLHIALKYGKIEIIELLLQYGADMCIGNKVGCTPLHMAASMNKMEIMKILLDHDPYLKDSVHKSIINIKDHYGGTALHIACLMKSHECMQLLMNYGADLTAENAKGNTVLHLATESRCVNVVKRLVNAKVPINVVNEYLDSPLHIAVMNNSTEIVEFFLKNKAATVCENKDHLIPLEMALKHRPQTDIMVISHLLQYAEDINDSYHRRAFCLAMSEMSEKDMAIQVFDLFFKYGFTLKPENDDINSLLYIAARNGHTTIVQMLLDLGANPNTEVNMEPVLYAAMKKKHVETIRILLKHGADPAMAMANEIDELALHNAIARGNSESFGVLLRTVDAKTLPELLQYVVRKCPRNCSEFIRILVERGVDVNAYYAGRHILLCLITDFCTTLDNEMKVRDTRMLWDYGVDLINAHRVHDFSSPFAYCTEMYRCAACIEVLLSYGADIHVHDSHGFMALELLLAKVYSNESYGILQLSEVIKICNMHVTKLRLAGLYIHPKILQQLQPYWLVDFEEQCLKELEMLKLLKLNAYVSAYDLLVRNLTEVARLTGGHDGLLEKVKEELRSGKYPLYGNYLIYQLARADRCGPYLSQAEDTLRRMYEKELPDLCIAKITGYLDVEDLMNLMKCGEDVAAGEIV